MTRVRRAHSFVLDLSAAQRVRLLAMADGRRAAWNFAVALDRDLYAADLPPADLDWLEADEADSGWRRSLDHYELNRAWPRYWRVATPGNPAAGMSAQLAFEHYTTARDTAVKAIGSKTSRKVRLPGFSSRHDPHRTFSVRGVKAEGGRISVTNVGWVKVAGSTRRLEAVLRDREGVIKLAHLTRTGVHAPWRIAVIVEHDQNAPEMPAEKPIVGLDLGIGVFATLSDGTEIPNPKPLTSALRRLRRASKATSRCEQARQAREAAARVAGTLGSRERLPKSRRHLAAEAVVARLHRRVTDLRSEFHHATSRRLVETSGAIGIEDLAAANLIRNRRLSQAISDAGWSSFVSMLDYKAPETGCAIVRAGRWFPSSQTCSACGHRHRAIKDLGIRHWTCPSCGVIHERDANAATNLIPTESRIAVALSARTAEGEKAAAKRASQKERVRAAQATKLARREAHEAASETARSEKHDARLARHASRKDQPLARTPRERRNARRDPVRPKPTPAVGAVARTDEARTEHPPLRTSRRSRVSLGAPTSLVPHGTG